MPKLDVKVFYARSCPRCKPIHAIVAKARERLGERGIKVNFLFYDTDTPAGDFLADRYDITRIPSIVIYGDKYFVGVPDIGDLVGTLAYLAGHPEGGHGRKKRG